MTTPVDIIRTENLKSANQVSYISTQILHVTTYNDPTGTSKALQ